MSLWTAEDFANAVSGFRRQIAGMARRMVVTLSSGPAWQVLGHTTFGTTREAPNVEAYQGIGFASRPAAGTSSAEAIVLNVGGPNNPAIVATRDEALRSASAGDLEDDEAAVFNTTARVRVRKDGTIEIASISGLLVEPTIRGTTYRAAEDTMLTAVSAAVALIASIPGLTAPQIAIVTAATAAITAFEGAASTYVTTVARVE